MSLSLPNADQWDNINGYLTQLCINTGGMHNIDSWKEIQDVVRQGLAPNYFNVGDQFKVQKSGSTLTFDVLGFDYDTPSDSNLTHSMTLGLHDVFTYSTISFDVREAFYACTSALSAGTYNFTIGEQPWYAGDVGKTVQFTLTSSVSEGAQFVLTNNYNESCIGKNVQVFSGSNSTTVLQTCLISEGSAGTSLGTIRSSFVWSGNLNSIQRALFGNNNYAQSGHRQFLNGNTAGTSGISSWWTGKNKWDRPQTSSLDGFLYGLDADFVSVLGQVRKRTALSTLGDSSAIGQNYIDTDELIFSQSRCEIFGSAENGVYESSWGTDGILKTIAYPYWQGANNYFRRKYQGTTARYYWMRSPDYSSASGTRLVSTDGSLLDSLAHNAIGVVPACSVV